MATNEGHGGHPWSRLVTSKPLQPWRSRPKSLERATRIELAFSAWEAVNSQIAYDLKILVKTIIG